MKLQSDFRDYYDCMFDRDSDGPMLVRNAKASGLSKQEQFKLLDMSGYPTPPHGMVGEVLNSWWESEKRWIDAVVAYTDPMAHASEGKELWWKRHPSVAVQPKMGFDAKNDRVAKNRELFCSAFLGNYATTQSVSRRRLQIGPHVFWIEYRSFESWMSNCGDGDCTVLIAGLNAGYHPHIKRPLFAIDFVVGREQYAVDYNIAPGIRGTGVEKHLGAVEALEAIKTAHGDGVWDQS